MKVNREWTSQQELFEAVAYALEGMNYDFDFEDEVLTVNSTADEGGQISVTFKGRRFSIELVERV